MSRRRASRTPSPVQPHPAEGTGYEKRYGPSGTYVIPSPIQAEMNRTPAGSPVVAMRRAMTSMTPRAREEMLAEGYFRSSLGGDVGIDEEQQPIIYAARTPSPSVDSHYYRILTPGPGAAEYAPGRSPPYRPSDTVVLHRYAQERRAPSTDEEEEYVYAAQTPSPSVGAQYYRILTPGRPDAAEYVPGRSPALRPTDTVVLHRYAQQRPTIEPVLFAANSQSRRALLGDYEPSPPSSAQKRGRARASPQSDKKRRHR